MNSRLLVGPLSPTVRVHQQQFSSPLNTDLGLGAYLHHPCIFPFYVSVDALASMLPVDPEQLLAHQIFPHERQEWHLSGDLKLQPLIDATEAHFHAVIWWGLQHGLPSDLAEVSLPKILVVSDWHFHYLAMLPFLDAFDLILCDEKLRRHLTQDPSHKLTQNLAQKTQYWPAYSFSPKHITQTINVAFQAHSKRDIDVLFVGGHNPHKYQERNRYLWRLAQMENINIRRVIRSDLSHDDYFKLLCRSKIAFNHGLRQEMNLRAYDAAACGSLLMMPTDNLEINRFLEPNKSYVPYTAKNFEAQILFYLKNTQERDRIAAAAQQAIQKHTYTRQFERLLKHVESRLKKDFVQPCQSPDALAAPALFLTLDVPILRKRAVKALAQLAIDSPTIYQIPTLNALLVSVVDAHISPVQNLDPQPFLLQTLQRLSALMAVEEQQRRFPVVVYNLAWSSFFLNQFQAAGYWIQRYFAVQQEWLPDAGMLRFLLPLRRTGLHLVYQQAAYQGMADLKQAMEGGSLFMLGYLNRRHDPEAALSAFEACVSRIPAMAEAYFEMAHIRLEQGHETAAVDCLKKGLDQGVFFPGAWELLLSLRPNYSLQQALLRLFQDQKHQQVRERLLEIKCPESC